MGPTAIFSDIHANMQALEAVLLDARTLARRLGKDPTRWADIKEVLPLLSRKKYYSTLRHGYARGGEPVAHVNKVRHYLEVLEDYLQRNGQELAGPEPPLRRAVHGT